MKNTTELWMDFLVEFVTCPPAGWYAVIPRCRGAESQLGVVVADGACRAILYWEMNVLAAHTAVGERAHKRAQTGPK